MRIYNIASEIYEIWLSYEDEIERKRKDKIVTIGDEWSKKERKKRIWGKEVRNESGSC